VTLRDLIDWTSRDAVRFFLISRKADTEFTFDVDLALKQNDENPVFYVQYAHARICSIIRNWGGDEATLKSADLSLLSAPTEAALMLRLAEYPAMLSGAAASLAPHDVAFYLRDLAGAFHSYYAAERVLDQAPELTQARIALLAATRQVIRWPRRPGKRWLRPRPDRGPAAGPGRGAGRGALCEQGARALRQQAAAAHCRAGQRGSQAQPELGSERAPGQ
jgi:hypothetical protein